MPQANDLSRSPVALNQDSTLIAVVEVSRSSWLVAGMVPGFERHPAKKLEPDEAAASPMRFTKPPNGQSRAKVRSGAGTSSGVRTRSRCWVVSCRTCGACPAPARR